MTISKTFSAVGVSLTLFVRRGEEFDYSVDVSGDFNGRIWLERSDNAGLTWEPVLGAITADVAETRFKNHDKDANFRFNCTLNAAGTALAGTAAVELSDVEESARGNDIVNHLGEVMLRVEETKLGLPNGKKFEFAQTYGGAGSYQPIAADLELAAAAGTSEEGEADFLAAMMGNLLGADLTGDHNYLGGLIGMYSITGVKQSTYPSGGVLGIIGDTVTDVDGAFVAVLDGDSGQTIGNAAFKAMGNNSTPGSGFNYGLDLHSPAHDGYDALAILKADLRLSSEVCVLSGAGAPVDGTTGDNFAAVGSLYIDRTNADVYQNVGTITDSVWKKIKRAGESIKVITNAASVAKVGGTAGWVVAAADNLGLVTCPAEQTASKLVIPITGLKVGQIITGFHLLGQIESGGGAVTVDADLRKHTAAAADVADASVGAMTQLSVTADTIMSASNTTKGSLAETVGADETFYLVITATTAAATDIALQGVAVTVSEA